MRRSRGLALRRLAFVVGAVLGGGLPGAPTPVASAAETPIEGLQRALRDRRPEARALGVRTTAPAVAVLAPDERRRAVLLLRKALPAEAEVDVRVAMVEALAGWHDEAAWIPVVQAALSDRAGPDTEAARSAVLLARDDLVRALEKALPEDEDPTYRAEVALLLGRRRRVDAIPLLLVAVGDRHPRAASAAAEALEAITGQPLGLDPGAWKAWAAREVAPNAPSPGSGVTKEPDAPRIAPPPPPPRGVVPTCYGLRLASKDVVFVVDVSGSVGDGGLEGAKRELSRAVERLASDVRISVLLFAEEVTPWHPEMIAATPRAKADLARFLSGVSRGRRTDVMTALNAGLAIVRRRTEARAAAKEPPGEPVTMVVVSDGQENVHATPGEVVGDRLDRLDLARAVVHAVVVGGRDNALMAALARRAGGTYRVVP